MSRAIGSEKMSPRCDILSPWSPPGLYYRGNTLTVTLQEWCKYFRELQKWETYWSRRGRGEPVEVGEVQVPFLRPLAPDEGIEFDFSIQ